MKTYKGYRAELQLNNVQTTACYKHAGAARYAYNWGLEQKKRAYANGEKTPTAIDLHRQLVVLKQGPLSWLYEVSKWAPQEALRNLDRAYDNYFKKRSDFPKFKNKRNSINSFRLYGSIKVSDNYVKLPYLGVLKLKERGYLPLDAKILSATVSEHAGRWFVSILVEKDIPEYTGVKDAHDVVGVDLGIKTLATVSDGTSYENPKALRAKLRKLKRFQ